MAKINRNWHDKNRMPKNATTAQRIKWHTAHAKACTCRPIPLKLQRLIEKSAEKLSKSSKKTAIKTSLKKK